MTTKQFAAVLGFAFVAAWIGFNFGYALLCLVGAGVFYLASNFLESSELDLSEIQSRLGGGGGDGGQPTPPPRPRPGRARVR